MLVWSANIVMGKCSGRFPRTFFALENVNVKGGVSVDGVSCERERAKVNGGPGFAAIGQEIWKHHG